MRSEHQPLKCGAFLGLERSHRQPDDQQVYTFHPHVVQSSSEHGKVLRRLAIALMHLLGVKDIGRQMHIGPYFVDQPIDRDAHGLAPTAHRIDRFIAFGRIGDRRKVRTPDLTSVDSYNKFGVAKTNIECPDDRFHAFLRSHQMHPR